MVTKESVWNQSKMKSCEREIIREHLIHKDKLLRTSSRIDNHSPKSMKHIQQNAKKRFLAKVRVEEINHSNKILVEKLVKVKDRDLSLSFNERNSFVPRNKNFERLSQIAYENCRIFNKIQSSKPYYSAKKLKTSYRYSVNLREMISRNANRVPRTIDFKCANLRTSTPTSTLSPKCWSNTHKLNSLIIL